MDKRVQEAIRRRRAAMLAEDAWMEFVLRESERRGLIRRFQVCKERLNSTQRRSASAAD